MEYDLTLARKNLRLRLNRIIGQLEALKDRLDNGSSDCLFEIRQIKAAYNALKKVAEEYLQIHLQECLRENLPTEQIHKNLQSVIQSVFTV
ncbi:MAG: metal-sensitive transcriptional regulator [Turneriella sp.]|nr:metal-sensitive transcriptional regulator [Turneriella sp.]